MADSPPSRSVCPQILIDQPDDGYCETVGWVEAIVTEQEAREALAEFCCEEDGEVPYVPTGPAKRVLMRLSNPKADYESQRWVPCSHRAKHAVEYWEIVVA